MDFCGGKYGRLIPLLELSPTVNCYCWHVKYNNNNNNNNLPPWIRSFDLFRHRPIAIISCDVHDLFFLEVFS